MDLSNAFEDGKACLEGLEERRKAGKVSEAEETSTMKGLKERFREEYRKVVRLFVPVRFPVVMKRVNWSSCRMFRDRPALGARRRKEA